MRVLISKICRFDLEHDSLVSKIVRLISKNKNNLLNQSRNLEIKKTLFNLIREQKIIKTNKFSCDTLRTPYGVWISIRRVCLAFRKTNGER